MRTKINLFAAFCLVMFTFSPAGFAQEASTATTAAVPPASAPSTADVIRQRVDKAKAYIAVKNFSAAIYELENIKRETSDTALDSVINVLLMNSYLEQNNYKRAEDFLTRMAGEQQAGQPGATQNYFAVAAQVIRSAKIQLERYHSLGLNVSDRNLPVEAAADIENMRQLLERVVGQAKELGKTPANVDTAMALLEGATNARGRLAKDDYDENRWKTEVLDAREMMASSRTKIIDAVNPPPAAEKSAARTVEKTAGETQQPDPQTVARKSPAEDAGIALEPVADQNMPEKTDQPAAVEADDRPRSENLQPKAADGTKKAPEKILTPDGDRSAEKKSVPKNPAADDAAPPKKRKRIVVGSAPKKVRTNDRKDSERAAAVAESRRAETPIEVGALTQYATRTASPVYPRMARNMRMTGIVRVDVVVDERGEVVEVQNTDGPSLLKRAARDAIRKWKFKPFERDGQPVRAVGYVSFNFSL